uniref:Uncharacterized protein n=1 Tax=Noctiluca scintillans TaxID=2966 RepID=A0A7S1APZ9_NOCSC|mmetsp:Transcript_5533/g.15891  ORF Transcript_5533/g.15891 Transcript_5533/m.15891 type:complete len:189 (+) Transcript_5533:38-604(+)
MPAWGRKRLRSVVVDGEVVIDDSDVEIVGRSPPMSFDTTENPLRVRAALRLSEALGGHGNLSQALVDAFMAAAGSDASKLLRSFISAVKSNGPFRESVLQGGIAGAALLVTQDPQEWASDETKARREAWREEVMAEVAQDSREVRKCPECGGKAKFETGHVPGFKLTKIYEHYHCMEASCGKVSHITE